MDPSHAQQASAQRSLAIVEARLAATRDACPGMVLPPHAGRAMEALRRAAEGSSIPSEDMGLEGERVRHLLIAIHQAARLNPVTPPPPAATAMDALGVTWLICAGLGALCGIAITYLLWLGAGNSMLGWADVGNIVGGGGIVGAILGGIAGFPISALVVLVIRILLIRQRP